ncbi:hypothetical protein NPIL_696711 [Nephila pilipes]|uniref:Uncharacterized protein n=1 Tax=Nephila pilipes TaxID=299642 RepID=A0A8X6N7T4_NEPPI|nr:hypothetical protein NPIL_696711 [Nephila pilipes]
MMTRSCDCPTKQLRRWEAVTAPQYSDGVGSDSFTSCTMVKDKPPPDKKDDDEKESDARDPEVLVVDRDETIDDLEEPSQVDSDTDGTRRRRGRDRERRMRDSSDDESSSFDSTTDDEKFKPRFRGCGSKELGEGSPHSLSSVDKSKKRDVSSGEQTPEVQEKLDLDVKHSCRPSSSSESGDSSVKKSKSLDIGKVIPEREGKSKDLDSSEKKEGYKYTNPDCRKKRGRSKERRLRDSSQSSSSSWSSDEESPYAKARDPNRKIEVKIELEKGIPVRGWQATSKKSEVKSKTSSDRLERQSRSKKRSRGSSSSSSGSESPSKLCESKLFKNVDQKAELKKEYKKKYVKSSIDQPHASTSRRLSRSPEPKYKSRGREKGSSTSSDSNSDSGYAI